VQTQAASSIPVFEPAQPPKSVEPAPATVSEEKATENAIANFKAKTVAYKRVLLSNDTPGKVNARGQWNEAVRNLKEHVDLETSDKMVAKAKGEIMPVIKYAFENAKSAAEAPKAEAVVTPEEKQKLISNFTSVTIELAKELLVDNNQSSKKAFLFSKNKEFNPVREIMQLKKDENNFDKLKVLLGKLEGSKNSKIKEFHDQQNAHLQAMEKLIVKAPTVAPVRKA